METKHTPGPWHLDRRKESRPSWYDENNYEYYTLTSIFSDAKNEHMAICQIPYGKAFKLKRSKEDQLANARLIAAAPELLEALQRAVECEQIKYKADKAAADYTNNNTPGVGIDFPYQTWEPLPAWVSFASEAIKKATEGGR